MIINELAYKVTLRADEFLNGKKKVESGVKELSDTATKGLDEVGEASKKTGDQITKTGDKVQQSNKKTARSFTDAEFDVKKFGSAAVSSFRGVTTAAAGFLGIGAGLYGVKQLFTSTANEIVRASQEAKFFGSDVNKMFGVRRGFKEAGLNGDAFIGSSGNARMALANIADPTVFGGLTGAAQNLLTLGARTGLNVNQLGDPNKALSEFSRYGKNHSQENLMQVMSASGFDPTDAAKIKSGELKSLVDSETKKSNITAKQVKEQEKLAATLGQLDAKFVRLKNDLAIAFAPDVINGLKAFGTWIENNHGKIIGFFKEAGETVKKMTDSIGGANTLLLLLAAGLRANPLVLGAMAAASANNAVDKARNGADSQHKNVGEYLYDRVHEKKKPLLSEQDLGKAWDFLTGWMGSSKAGSMEPNIVMPGLGGSVMQHAQSAKMERNPSGRFETLLDALKMTESGGDPFAYNASGATGAYQLMPPTARELGLRVDSQVDERLDPEKSRAAASIYMSKLLKRYKGNVSDSLMAYNWGMGNVDQWIDQGRGDGYTDKKGEWHGLPAETREYPGKVADYYQQMTKHASTPANSIPASVDKSQSSSTHIGNVNVYSNPQSADALAKSANEQVRRAGTNAAFSSSVR
jgi:hypothetical protein